MADVFISYSSKNKASAQTLAATLSGLGHSVWWDREILTGQAFDRAIEQELDGARCVVVLWSNEAVDSEWVKNEAASAAARGVLLPANIDGSKLPLEFRRKQTADLVGWDGGTSHEGFQALHRGIVGLLGAAPLNSGPASAAPLKALPAPTGADPARRKVWASISIAVVALAGVGYALLNGRGGPSPPQVSQSQGSVTPPALGSSAAVAAEGLAQSVVGIYDGEVIADSKGSSRTHIVVTVEKLSANAVRVSSPYSRVGTMDIELTQVHRTVSHALGDTPFAVDLAASPPKLTLNPRNELAYVGRLRR
jgi:hypothetical protein